MFSRLFARTNWKLEREAEVSLNYQDLSNPSQSDFQSCNAVSGRGNRSTHLFKPSLNTHTINKRSNIMSNQKISSLNISSRATRALIEIEACAKSAADSGREFLNLCDMEAYKRFLHVMYHYTLESGKKCSTAAKNINAPDVKELFLHFDEEEALHFRLALKDIQAFGEVPSEEVPDTVNAIDHLWTSLEGRHHNGYLGMLYVYENIAKYVQQDVEDCIKRLGLGSTEKRWLTAHAKEDLEHGQVIMDMLKKHIEDNPTIAVSAAKQASALWSTMMLDIIDEGYQKLPLAA